MVRLAVIALALAACGRLGFDELERDPSKFRKQVVLQPFPVTVTGLPIAIVLDGDPDLVAHARPDGADLHVVDGDGMTPLPYELVSYDAATGALELWVRVPQVSASTSHDLYLKYGGGDPASSVASPWGDDFAAVWHMEQREGTVFDQVGDNDGRQVSLPLRPGMARGIVGAAASFDGSDDTLLVGDPANGSLDFGLRSFSYSMWVNVTASVGSFDIPFHKGGSSTDTGGYDIELGMEGWAANLSDNVTLRTATFGLEPDFLGDWVQLVATVDRETGLFRAYANGVLGESTDLAGLGSVDSTDPVQLGRATAVFQGLLDEVRLYNVVLPQDYIIAGRAALADRAALIQLGPEEPR